MNNNKEQHRKFMSIMASIGVMNKIELAEWRGVSYGTIRNQVSPNKPLPKWAVQIIDFQDSAKKNKITFSQMED